MRSSRISMLSELDQGNLGRIDLGVVVSEDMF
jgi:hypothetical protein